MGDTQDFKNLLGTAVSTKTDWFNERELPKLLENYRLLHSCVKTVYEVLVNSSLITPDPYKLDKKISDITVPSEEPFVERERAVVMGARLSDYESMIEFICTYFRFSVESLTLPKTKKLEELNDCLQWGSLSPNSPKVNTKMLAAIVIDARKTIPQMATIQLNESLSKNAQAAGEIAKILRELAEFQRELYKWQIRIDVCENPAFDKEKAARSVADEAAEIRRVYSAVKPDSPFYGELAEEVANEDLSPEKERLQQDVLRRLEIHAGSAKAAKGKVDTKSLLMDACRALSQISPEYAAIHEKLNANYQLLEGTHNTFADKLRQLLRKMFRLEAPPVVYNFVISDPNLQKQTVKPVQIDTFLAKIEKRSKFLAALSNRNSALYQRIAGADGKAILDFLGKQIAEDQDIHQLLTAADDYFKANTPAAQRSRIKGLKIDLITVKNAIIKAKSKCADYTSYIEEAAQMKKLGIHDAD